MSESTDNRSQPGSAADAQVGFGDLHRQSEEARALISRLTERLRKRDRRIAVLESALARTVLMHHVWASHLERKLERSYASSILPHPDGQRLPGGTPTAVGCLRDDPSRGVIVHLPHLTRTLEALFDVMREYWSEWDVDHPPKSSTVARAIDEKLGLKAQANGEASRSAQTFAAALRPDSVSEIDGRHR
ncbi:MULTISPECIES: hypothetical protein [Paraburkholderia]|uniref:hypothetical protein n=1 Tax=Paraburkholderia TaxID=1822464 RepID=UPI002855D0EA|nr:MULTISPECIES: hypothetical protein [Paraburkholderia]MDR6383456.1 hypothetical protein [Paraburkholderia caribensis]MDR6388915.1 hypothetical protein [Paraburkholderia phenoliruptrix]MDR6419226.1 hypothetical protein [Paraburkholderia phenoliruptrix]